MFQFLTNNAHFRFMSQGTPIHLLHPLLIIIAIISADYSQSNRFFQMLQRESEMMYGIVCRFFRCVYVSKERDKKVLADKLGTNSESDSFSKP